MARPRRTPDPAPEPEAAPEQPEGDANGFVPALVGEFEVSGLTDEQTRQLDADLDPGRVKTRQGRGQGKFEYLAGHDVIRTANRIFGYGNWGHEIVEQLCEAEVAVENDRGREGCHVMYRCVVRLSIRGCVPTSGTGYGDAVEYGPAARATARELALKESETDALKRALKNYGDQFGLGLYEKDLDRRKQAQEAPQDRPVRRAPDPQADVPKTYAEINERLERADPQAGWSWWIRQALEVMYPGGVTSVRDLSPGASKLFGQRLASITLKVEDAAGDLGVMNARYSIARIFADTIPELDGEALEGPPWRLGPEASEDGRPTLAEYLGQEAEGDQVIEEKEKAEADAVIADAVEAVDGEAAEEAAAEGVAAVDEPAGDAVESDARDDG